MSELRLDEYVMPAARLGPAHPLVPLWTDTVELVNQRRPGPGLTDDDVRHIGYGYRGTCLPYFVQDDYDRDRTSRPFRAAVLENRRLRATFLLDLGGRLWSLYDKSRGRELLHVNPVFQPGNLGIRNAWFSGGVEWNFCWIGHTPLTCEPLFAARARLDDGRPVLRMWEWERVRQTVYQIDAWLDDRAPLLLVRVRLNNPEGRTVPVYWWSNIAVPEEPGARVIVPADSYYRLLREEKVVLPYPVQDGVDYSYTVNSPHGGDRFFRIPRGQYPWIAWADAQGRGFFQSSSSRMIGRKLWVFGQGAGGRRWQDFLNTPGHPYIEIQGGLAQTQAECAPLPPRTEWEWVEAYGGFDAEPAAVHGDWPAAWRHTQGLIEAQADFARIEQLLAETKAMARRAPDEILHRGAGWGELEQRRRALVAQAFQPVLAQPGKAVPPDHQGEPTLADPAVPLSPGNLGPQQQPWLELLEQGRLPEHPPEQPPASWMVQDEWRQMLEASVREGRSDHWAAWLQLGTMYFEQGRHDEAAAAWETSVARRPSPWALRMLAALAHLRQQPARAAELYAQAIALAPGQSPPLPLGKVRKRVQPLPHEGEVGPQDRVGVWHGQDPSASALTRPSADLSQRERCAPPVRLLLESGRALIAAGRAGEFLAVLDRLDGQVRRNGHVRILEVKAALDVGQLERVPPLLAEDIVLPNLREGDAEPAELWFRYHELRLARDENRPVDEALKNRVRQSFPPPAHLDYRLHS